MGCGDAGVFGWHPRFGQRGLGCRLGSRRRIVSVWDGSHAVSRRGRGESAGLDYGAVLRLSLIHISEPTRPY